MADGKGPMAEWTSESVRERRSVTQTGVFAVGNGRNPRLLVQVETETNVLSEVIAEADAVRVHGVGAVRRRDHDVFAIPIVEMPHRAARDDVERTEDLLHNRA